MSSVGVAVSATKMRIIRDLPMAFSNPGVNGDIDFESAPECKLGHVLRDIVWMIFVLRRTFAPHTHIMLSKMDVKDTFRQVAVKRDGCTKFGYVFGDSVVVDRRLVFGWRNSPGFYCLLAGAIEHAHDPLRLMTPSSPSRDWRLPVMSGWTFRPRGRPRCSYPRSAGCPPDRGGGRTTGTFWARSYVDDTIGVEPLVYARGSRCLRESASLVSDHFRLFGPRLPTDSLLVSFR